MIIRSGLIRNRDGVDSAAFSEHWRHVHGPLALRVEAMRAYRQNHIVARLPASQGDKLHRIDGISQLWFDDAESMRVAMESDEQRACIEDIRGFLSNVTILIQKEGETRLHGRADRLPVKFIHLLSGPEMALQETAENLFADLALRCDSVALRINPVVDKSFSVVPAVPAGNQIIDAVMEIWLPKKAHDAAFRSVSPEHPEIGLVGSFQVDELVLKETGHGE